MEYLILGFWLWVMLFALATVWVSVPRRVAIKQEEIITDKEMKQLQKEWRDQQAYYKAHTCFRCKAMGADVAIEPRQFCLSERNVLNLTVCPKCTEELIAQAKRAFEKDGYKPTYPRYSNTRKHVEANYARQYGEIILEVRHNGEIIEVSDIKRILETEYDLTIIRYGKARIKEYVPKQLELVAP